MLEKAYGYITLGVWINRDLAQGDEFDLVLGEVESSLHKFEYWPEVTVRVEDYNCERFD